MRNWHALGVAGLTGFPLSALHLIEIEPQFFIDASCQRLDMTNWRCRINGS